MPKLPKISETEWEIMKVLWARAPLTGNEIFAALRDQDASWHEKTAKTLINRLVRKRALGFKKEGRGYSYRPLVSEEQCVAAESESFLERVFGGSFTPMLVHFVQSRKLSKQDLNELRRILNGRD